jgi:Holliday junction resolvase
MSNYSKGANFERKVKKWYESRDCFVIRSAGSHTPVDLVVFSAILGNPLPPLFIQAKLDGRFSKEEQKELVELATKYGGTALLVYKDKDREEGIGVTVLRKGDA